MPLVARHSNLAVANLAGWAQDRSGVFPVCQGHHSTLTVGRIPLWVKP